MGKQLKTKWTIIGMNCYQLIIGINDLISTHYRYYSFLRVAGHQ